MADVKIFNGVRVTEPTKHIDNCASCRWFKNSKGEKVGKCVHPCGKFKDNVINPSRRKCLRYEFDCGAYCGCGTFIEAGHNYCHHCGHIVAVRPARQEATP